jgi:hypothetical protein
MLVFPHEKAYVLKHLSLTYFPITRRFSLCHQDCKGKSLFAVFPTTDKTFLHAEGFVGQQTVGSLLAVNFPIFQCPGH